MSRPSIKSAPCAVFSALSSRLSCSVAESTDGLADVDVPKSLSRPCLDFADLSSPFFGVLANLFPLLVLLVPLLLSLPSPVQLLLRPVAQLALLLLCLVLFLPRLVLLCLAVLLSLVVPQFRPVFVRLYLPGFVLSSSIAASPVRSVLPGPVPSCPALPSVPVSPVAAAPFLRSTSCLPFVPMACFVLAVAPVLLATAFGFALSFLPVLR